MTTPFTAPPTAMAIRRSGARIVLADIEEGGYGLDAGCESLNSHRNQALLVRSAQLSPVANPPAPNLAA